MKKNLRNVAALALTGAMVLSTAACGGTSTDTTTAAEKETTAAAEGEDTTAAEDETAEANADETVTSKGTYTAENPYHCVFSYVEYYTQDEDARAAVQDAINEYMIPNYHIEVELLPLSASSSTTDITNMLSAVDELDIIPIYTSNAAKFINMDGVVDMNQFAGTEDAQAIEEALGTDLAHVAQMNGILFGLPANKEYSEIGGLAMRKDICDELGITEEYGLEYGADEYQGNMLPWSEATNIFEKVHEAYPDMTCLYIQGSNDQFNRFIHYDRLLDNFGVLDWETDNETTTVVNKYETQTYYDTCKMIAEWYDAGYIYKDAATDTTGATALMKAGTLFSYVTAIKPGITLEGYASTGTELYYLWFGNGVDSERGTETVRWTTNCLFYSTGIATNSEDPEMAYKFVRALYTDSTLYNMWLYGIEGENYQVNDDGTAYFVDGEDGSNYKYHQNIGWEMGNQFIGYVWSDGSQSPDYWEKINTQNEWGVLSKTFGFIWDSSDYSTEMTALSAALAEYRPAIETGSVGVAGLDEAIKNLNDSLYAAGLQTVIDAKQEQLDAWLEENNK